MVVCIEQGDHNYLSEQEHRNTLEDDSILYYLQCKRF